MRIIESSDIDKNKWDALVAEHSNSLYSYSWYLDELSENWSVLVDDAYTSGIALPYASRLGVDTLYNPIFGGYTEMLGRQLPEDQLALLLSKRFPVIEISIRQAALGVLNEPRVAQEIVDWTEFGLRSQAKTSLKKAAKNELSCSITNEYDRILSVARRSLAGKFQGLNETSFNRLKNFLANRVSICFEVTAEEPKGGIICLETDSTVLYLKGAVSDDVKTIGGMYLALHSAIQYAKEQGKRFDFGGSNVEGVQKFNHNLGGVNFEYYHYSIDNAPLWYKLSKRLNKLSRGK